MKDKWGNASQVDDMREHPIHRCAVPLPQMGKAYETRIPLFSHCQSEYMHMWKNNTDGQSLSPWGKQRGGGFAAKKGSQPRLAALGSPFQGKGLA